jgi:predicted amidohydrolase
MRKPINSSSVLFLAAALSTVALQAAVREADLIPADGSCWKRFAPRETNAPVGELLKGDGKYSLTLSSGGKKYVYGGWKCRIEGIEPERHYRVRATFTPKGLKDPAALRESVGVQVRWRGDFGGAVAPSYVWDVRAVKNEPGTFEFDRVLQAPQKTRAAELELVLQWTSRGEIEWRSVSLQPAPPPDPRPVRLATVWLRPQNSRTGADSVAKFAEYIDTFAPEHRPDVIVLGEMINRVGVRGEPDVQAEPIPGPTTERLAERARKHRTWIAFSIVERKGSELFNTAVLLNREGRIAGTYRKVQLPFEEVSLGIAPGSDFPVFDTDFGRVGMLICHDASFPEAARELALNGAEIILMPIWGGRQTLVRARAMENGVYLATSGYDYPSEIISPTGDVVAEVPVGKGPAVAFAEIDLSRRFRQDWIGDWNDSYQRQQRPSAYRK